MNKKQFNRVKSLYRDKVSTTVCVITIIELSNSHTEAATFISKFYNEMIVDPIKLELEAWQEVERRIRQPLNGEIKDESSNRA